MQVFQELNYIVDVDYLNILYAEDHRNLHAQIGRKTKNISHRIITGIKKLQLYLKHVQQRGNCEIGTDLNYSSIE